MALIEYDLLESPTAAYETFRFDLFITLFGNSLTPFVDASGRPRIGTSIDLVSDMQAAATVIIGAIPDAELLARLVDVASMSYSSGDSALLKSRLDEVLTTWANQRESSDFPTSFEFFTVEESRLALTYAMVDVENSIGSFSSLGIPLSEERAVIASLAFCNYPIDDMVSAMISDQDRIAPWLEMRYIDRTGSGGPTNAEAARRYYQSAVFELYNDPDNVGFAEAVDVGVAYSAARRTILSYERDFDPEVMGVGSVAAGGKDAIATILQPAIAAVAEFYFADVARADELIFATDGEQTLFGDNPSDNFNSAKNDDDFMIGTSSVRSTLIGGQGNDVIVALGGADRVEGGDGDDTLYGGTGADTIIGGDGNDRIRGGGGVDVLEGGLGDDTYYFGGNEELDPGSGGNPAQIGAINGDVIVEKKGGGIDTLVVQVNNGNFSIRQVEKFQLAADVTGNIKVKLNEFDNFTLSSGDDDLTLVINRLQKKIIEVVTGDGNDVVHIEFKAGVDPSQVLNGKGLTARFSFSDLTEGDTIDLTSIGIRDIITERSQIDVDKGFYLLAPGVKLDLMDGDRIEKTYNNYTENWFVVKCGDKTPYGPEFIGNLDATHFDI